MRDRVGSLTGELLTAAERKGKMDLIRDYALPLPTTIIAELLGVPPNERHAFHRWSSAIVSLNFSKWSMLRAVPNVWSFLSVHSEIGSTAPG